MNRIRQLRRQKNMTQQEVGQALGVGNTAVSMYENGRRSLDDKTIRNLCALFGCSADYLLGLSAYTGPILSHAADTEDRKAIDKMLR